MSSHVTLVAELLEVGLMLVGLVLLWRHVASPEARRAAGPSPLPAWDVLASELLIFLLLVLLGNFFAAILANTVLKSFPQNPDAATMVSGAAGQLGMLAGIALYASRSPGFRAHAPLQIGAVVRSGVVTFLIALPILVATSKAWEILLELLGVPAVRQDLIRLFAQAKSPGLAVSLVTLATVVAPVTEELVFRAGLFRFLRTRAPRNLALLLPALLFASLHVTNWKTLEGFASFAPLVVLAVVFSLAYERTGHIGTAMIAHGLFNLNTILLIYAGVGV